MKQTLKKYWWTIIIVLIIGRAFYWFEWRPAQIKHDCSWAKKHSDAVPAMLAWPGKTQKEIDECMRNASSNNISSSINLDKLLCPMNSAPRPAEPAQPAKDWWEKASKTEYDFCVHEKGL